MSRRKGRPLAPEEEELWRAVRKSVTPLRPEKVVAPPAAIAAAEPEPQRPPRSPAADCLTCSNHHQAGPAKTASPRQAGAASRQSRPYHH